MSKAEYLAELQRIFASLEADQIYVLCEGETQILEPFGKLFREKWELLLELGYWLKIHINGPHEVRIDIVMPPEEIVMDTALVETGDQPIEKALTPLIDRILAANARLQ